VGSKDPVQDRAGYRDGAARWPVRVGAVPPLADGFSARPETAPGLAAALVPGATVVLEPGRPVGAGGQDWPVACGKAQLAAYLSELLWRSREIDLLVWVVATSRTSVLSGYSQAAAAIWGEHPASDAESTAAHFLNWLRGTSRSWLIVLHDLPDVAELEGLWPESPAGRTLLTTVKPVALPAGRTALVLPVGAFSAREAMNYLMVRLSADPDQRLGAMDLVKDLNSEPLALSQAAAVITGTALSCAGYRDYYVRRRDYLAQSAETAPHPAAVTWTFCFEQVNRESPDGTAQSALALAALLDGHGIPGAVFETTAAGDYLGTGVPPKPPAPPPEPAAPRAWAWRAPRPAAPAEQVPDVRATHPVWVAMSALERAGLLAVDTASDIPVVWTTPAVQAAVRSAMPDSVLAKATRAAADALREAWPPDAPFGWLAGRLRSCVTSLLAASGDLLWAGGGHPLLAEAGRSLDDARQTVAAVEYWAELASVSGRLLGQRHPHTLAAGERLAQAYLTAGQATEATAWFQWVLADRIRRLGSEHPDTIAARRGLGHALTAAGQPGDAVTVLTGAVSDYERMNGTSHPDTLAARDELAVAYLAAGQLAEAIQLGQHTLGDRERVKGPRDPLTMTTRERLGDAYLADGQVKEAIASYKRTLADRESILGPDHPDTIAARGALGSAYHAAGRTATAVQLYEQAGADYERVLGASHPDTLARRANLAHAYYTAGRLTDATTVLRSTLARCERSLPPGDPLTEAVRESLASIAPS
jgi:tetratricopeptide (TPR) repeat protein